MITKAEFEKRDGSFVVRAHHVEKRRVKVPLYSGGKPTGEFREMEQGLGEWKEEFFTDEDAAKARYQVIAGAVTNV